VHLSHAGLDPTNLAFAKHVSMPSAEVSVPWGAAARDGSFTPRSRANEPQPPFITVYVASGTAHGGATMVHVASVRFRLTPRHSAPASNVPAVVRVGLYNYVPEELKVADVACVLAVRADESGVFEARPSRNARFVRVEAVEATSAFQLFDFQLELQACWGASLYAAFAFSLSAHAQLPCLGTRAPSDEVFQWQTYGDVHRGTLCDHPRHRLPIVADAESRGRTRA
jgi:hypothetical protein